jgi:hypothetical protein
MAVASRTGHLRLRTGPRDPELRRARICYDRLAGDTATASREMIAARANGTVRLTKAGERFFSALAQTLMPLPAGDAPSAAPARTGASAGTTLPAHSERRCATTSMIAAGPTGCRIRGS